MRIRALAMFVASSLLYAADSPSPSAKRLPDSYRYANLLLPAIVSLADQVARGMALERKRPEFITVATGRDEYIYHLRDKVFIRTIKDRFDKAPWQICGDFSVARVEFQDDSMKTIPPIMSWYMIFRDEQWERLVRDEEGRFLRSNFNPAELPPYAERCFDLSPRPGQP